MTPSPAISAIPLIDVLAYLSNFSSDEPCSALKLADHFHLQGKPETRRRYARCLIDMARHEFPNQVLAGPHGYHLSDGAKSRHAWQEWRRVNALHQLHTARRIERDEQQIEVGL